MLDLYKTLYKFKGNPFRLSPDHGFSFDHNSYANAKAYLKYGIAQGEGFVAIIGGPGTGKTTLINQLLAELDTTRVTAAKLSTAQLDSCNLLNLVAHAFGLHIAAGSEASPVLQLEEFLKRQSQRGRRTVLIVDEAQGLSPGLLEELRLLSNFQADNQLLLQVFLVGQGQLLGMLHTPAMEQLRQRLIAVAHLEPLDLDQTVGYIERRLCHVGWKGDPAFGEGALRLIHKFSGGVPRQINLICHRLFLSGGLQGKPAFGGEDAQRVIEELYKEGLLGAEVPDESEAEDVVARPTDAETPVRSLPRPGSVAGRETPRPGASRRDSREPKARLAAKTQSVSLKPDNKSSPKSAARLRQEQREKPTARANARADVNASAKKPSAVADNRDTDRSLRTKLIELLDKAWPGGWRWAAAVGLVASVVLFTFMEMQIDRQAGGFRSAFSTVSGTVALDSDPNDRGDPTREGTPMTNGADPASAMASPTGPSTQRDSAAAGVMPGPDRLAMIGAEQKQTLNGDTGEAEESRELPVVGDVKDVPQSPVVENTSTAPRQADEAAKGRVLAGPQDAAQSASEHDKSELESSSTMDQSGVAELGEGRSGDAGSATEQAAVEPGRVRLRGEAAEPFVEQPTANEVANASRSASAGKEATKAKSSVSVEPSGGQVVPVVKNNASDNPGSTEKQPAPAKPGTASTEGAGGPAHPSTASVTKVAVKPASPETKPAAPTMIAQASRQETKQGHPDRNKYESLLLESHWNSEGKPALLLPSELSSCKREGNHVSCRSVPQSTTTRRGQAQYKVEATLQGFTAGGAFLLSYRTLVKLTGENTPSEPKTASDDGGWQVTEHAMECQLIEQSKVRCQDESGSTRDYQRSGSAKRE